MNKLNSMEICTRIADEIEAYASGNAYKCPHCGKVHDFSAFEETEHKDAEGYTHYTCPDCGEEIDEYALEAVGIYDYFSDVLDIDYRVNAQKEYVGARLWVTLGGPNICIDTEKSAVCLKWWGDTAERLIDVSTCDAIDDYARELYDSI